MNTDTKADALTAHVFNRSRGGGCRAMVWKGLSRLPGWARRRLGALTRAEWERVVREGLFDVAFYLANHPELVRRGGDPWIHYCRRGWREGKDPSLKFSTRRYLEVRPDVARAGICPLIHYCISGVYEGMRPFPVLRVRPKSTRGSDDAAAPVPVSARSVLFLSGEPVTPGHKYRVAALAASLPREVYDVQIATLPDVEDGWLPDPDRPVGILWLWRCRMSPELDAFLDHIRAQGGVIHGDVDDLMFEPDLVDADKIDGVRSMGLDPGEIKKLYADHLFTLCRSDQSSSPTEPLCRAMRERAVVSYLVPNGFTHADFQRAREAAGEVPDDGRFRIGYACGSRTHQRDFARILPGLVRFLDRHPEALLVVYPYALLLEEYPELAPFRKQIEKRDMVPVEELVHEYARYDVNLAPVEVGNPFCEAKSQLKFFEAALSRTPTIASPTHPFRVAIRHGENGFLADGPEEWEEVLESCISDRERLQAIGDRAYRSVLWAHSQDRQQWLLERVISAAVEHEGVAAMVQAQLFSGCGAQDVYRFPAVSPTERLFHTRRHVRANVSVVLPVYNYAHYLEEALESVRLQTLEDLDVVLVDDGSTDDSVAVALKWLEAHADRFGCATLLRHTGNRKLGAARNTGVDATETETFFPLDPDNVLQPECLEVCLRTLEAERVAAVYPALEIFGSERAIPNIPGWDAQRFVNGNYIDAMALIRKSVWTAVGGYATDPELLGWEDYEFWCKLAEHGFRGSRAWGAVARYRAHEQSMLATITDDDRFKVRVKQLMEQRHPWVRLSEL